MTTSGMRPQRTRSGIAYERLQLDAPWTCETRLPLVFQHGLGLDRTLWYPWVRAAARDRPVVTIDMRGHGGSVEAWQPGPLALDDVARDVLSVLDDCGIERCHYVGESFGGTLGLHLAGTADDRIASVTACSTGWKGSWFHNIRAWEGLLADGGIDAWSRMISAARFDSDRVDPALLAWVDTMQKQMDPAVVWGVAACLLDIDLTALLPTIEAPVLTVLGDSPFVDQRNLTGLVEAIPRGEAARIAGGRHGIALSHWRECAAACLNFVDRTERALHDRS